MHMTCGRNAGGCGFEFCWLCRGPWSEHGSHTGGYYNCNKYDKSGAKDEDMKANDAKTELEHYMFFYHRYESHKNALKIADEQRRNADKKQTLFMEKFDVRAVDTRFMMEATNQLIAVRSSPPPPQTEFFEFVFLSLPLFKVTGWTNLLVFIYSYQNRRVLQWSYVYGFYLSLDKTRTAEKNLYEYLQEDLEKHTNYLSELYERPMDKIPDYQAFIEWKKDVANYTRVCSKVKHFFFIPTRLE